MNALSVLTDVFGYDQFRGRQAEVIQHVSHGHHVLLIMPTGGGKSLCYQIPALMQPARTDSDSRPTLSVVLSPLIALMKDQVDALRQKGVEAAFINSSLSGSERDWRYGEVAAGKYRLLYVTPERFRKTRFVDVLRRRNITLLAVDEAHCVSQWGHDFRPDYSRVGEWRELMECPTTIALTATATPEVQHDILRQLNLDPETVHCVHEGIERPNLRLVVEPVWSDDMKLEMIAERCEQTDWQLGSGIVYFTLIRTLEQFSQRLLESSIPHGIYHGELPRDERRGVHEAFMTGRQPLVLATNAFGMGIDKENIRFVMHAEIPGSMESYYQEIGRAGRDGLPSECILLYDERDLMTQMEFIEWKNPNAEYFRRVYDLLEHDAERVQAFGLEWLNKQLQCRSPHDHRLDTVLALMDRHGVVVGTRPPACFQLRAELPDSLVDEAALNAKLQRDRKRLYALVEYVRCESDRKRFLNQYFGLDI